MAAGRNDIQASIAVDRSLAYALLRLVLGINIAMHGISRLAMGAASFAHGLVPLFAKTPLPAWSVYAFGLCLPWAEVLTGVLILAGAASRLAYVLGLLEIAALTFGSSLRQDWATTGIQLSYALVYSILLATREYNRYSVDGWMGGRRAAQ